MRPILDVARDKLGIPAEHVQPYGHYKGKIALEYIESLSARPDGKLILVTAITPTPAGEGKTTTTVGLTDGLNHIGKKALCCLREPSLGPCFGVKGGAAGGGYAQVVPMEDINLHFTGDFHAIGAANNLLAALIDNHVYWGNSLALDTRRISWRRVVDMNDRALRSIVSSLGGVSNGFSREDGFDITVASEVMAIFCLASSFADLQKRLGNIVVGQTRDKKNIRSSEVKAAGSMAALLKDAIAPNLVQTLENNPAIIHGGPFANIAHGCNSVIATKSGLKLADYVVTEAGFGADLGAEKFFDIKCRKAGLKPDLTVIVATIRALKMHGGVAKDDLKTENVAALEKGFANLKRHIANVRKFGVPALVTVNKFSTDTQAEMESARTTLQGGGRPMRRRRQLGFGRGRRGRSRARRGEDDRNAAVELQAALCRRSAARREGAHDRQGALRRGRHLVRRERQVALRRTREGRLRPFPGLHREDAIQLLDRPQRQGRALWLHHSDPRSASVGGRGVCRRRLRRHHDDARSAEGSGGQQHRGRGRRPHLRPVLIGAAVRRPPKISPRRPRLALRRSR